MAGCTSGLGGIGAGRGRLTLMGWRGSRGLTPARWLRLPEIDATRLLADIHGGHSAERAQVDDLDSSRLRADPLHRHERVAIVGRNDHATCDLPRRRQ